MTILFFFFFLPNSGHADEKNPNMGVIVKMMSSTRPKVNCSLSVSVICDSDGVQVRPCSLPSFDELYSYPPQFGF